MTTLNTTQILTDTDLANQGRYLNAYYSAVEVLQREQTYWLGVAKGMAGTQSERGMAAAAAAGLGQQILVLDSLHASIMDRFFKGLNPPSDVEKAVRLTERLAEDILSQVVTGKILEVVSTFVAGWAKL